MASPCPNFNLFTKYIREFNQHVEIDKDKDKPLRYDVWGTTPAQVRELFTKGIEALPGENNSPHVITKIKNALKRITESPKSAKDFQTDIIEDQHNIEFSIALHELIESVKGEADKANNLDIDVAEISNDGILPALPLSRIAASIGRKVAYQKGYRFKSDETSPSTAAQIEILYYSIGKIALQGLEQKGYVDLHEKLPSIKDYIDASEMKAEFPKTNVVTDKVLSVSLNSEKLGIKANSNEAYYFLKRSEADLDGTQLGVVTDMLSAVRQVTQPSTIVFPDTSPVQTKEQLAERDDPNIAPDKITEKVRKDIYDKPLHVHGTVHKLMTLLNQQSLKSGESGSKIIKKVFQGHPILVNGLFGLKRSDDFSIDKKASVAGQNLSKTTPLDDLVENYHIIQGDKTEPADLHMPMYTGRNARMYYENSVLNPHGSKQSRYMLTPGQYTVDTGTADFDYLVYGISQALGDNALKYDDFVKATGSKLDTALKAFTKFEKQTSGDNANLQHALSTLSDIAGVFPGVDYVTLLTTLKAVNDIRNPVDGKVSTEFSASADATASGGTLTFLQALGTKPSVEAFLQRLGLLKSEDGTVDISIDDIYGIMTEAVSDFVSGKKIEGLIGQDMSTKASGMRGLLQDTVDLLFDEGKNSRELSKGPTMTFVYGQGRSGAIKSMARSLGDHIIDNLDDKSVRSYLVKLFNDTSYRDIDSGKLKDTRGLYKAILDKLTQEDRNLPAQLYDLMNVRINQEYLEDFKARSNKVFEFVKNVDSNNPFKILPAAAVLAGVKPTLANLKKYGMPLTKVFEAASPVPLSTDTVLTRRQKLTKTVADVSTIHGIDAAQLYHSMNEVLGDLGSVVVHDEFRGDVKTVRAMEAKYREMTVKAISEYDIHQQVMAAVAAYDPELAKSEAFQALSGDISSDVAQKKQIMGDRFNHETDALIGDGNAYAKFAQNKPKTASKASPEAAAEEASVTPEAAGTAILTELADESPVIAKFLAMANKSNIELGSKNEFVPASDTVTVSGTDQGRGDTGRTLDLNNKADRKLQTELIEHEITHANTVAYITKAMENKNTPEGREVQYFQKVIAQLRKHKPAGNTVLSDEATGRVMYILGQSSEVEQVAEFVAIMQSESETATEIYNHLSKEAPSPRLMKRIRAFVEKVVQSFLNISEEDLAADIDIEKLYAALMSTVAMGETQRSQNYGEASRYLSKFDKTFGAGPQAAGKVKGHLNYLNYAVASMLNSKLERKGRRLSGRLHTMMKDAFPMYTDAANRLAGIYDESEALQQLLHTITGNGVNKVKKADVLAKFSNVMSQQTAIVNDQMGKFNKLLNPMSQEERAKIGRFVTDMPLHDYFVLASDVVTEDAIAAEVTRLEKEVGKVEPQAVRDVKELIAWNVLHEENSKGKIYNLEAKYPMQDSKFGEDVRKLLALKSIQTIGAKDFESLLENTDLVNLLKDTSVANRLSLLENEGSSNLGDSLVMDYYKEPLVIEAIELGDLKRYENGENTGWKVLRAPTKTELGIVYKHTIDSSTILGAYTDTKLSSTDITITGSKTRYPGVVKTRDGHKLRISRKDKIKLGLVEDFSQGLVRSTAHSMAIQESQIIRDELLKEDTRMIIGKDTSELQDIIKAENVDNPWFVKLEEGTSYLDLDKSIRAKYKPVGSRASDVKNFNGQVDLVRKDISHWLLGGSSSSLFQNPQMKWATRIVKDLVAGAKIGMVVLNPMKIAQDNISNVSYLGVMGVSPLFIAKNYKNITRDFQEYSDLQRQIIQLKVQMVARPDSDKLKKQLKMLRDKVSRNSLGDISDKGFINSLGSDLVAKNADTLSGLQADMHTALEYLLINKEGKKNYVSHFITRLQNLGFSGEDFLTYIGKIANKTGKSGKGIQSELDQVAERLQEIRTEEDIVNYVSQYTNSPASEAVRLGASMTDLTDVLAKETLYRHLVETEKASPEAARIKVLDSFPDYKENMPLAVKQLSDFGIIMFPSFWLRIQKVIYRMARDKPVNLATELMLEEAFGSNINTIIDANIVNKANTFGGLLHTPLEPIGAGSIFPTHLW